jgi:hypothetical protein
MQLFKTTTTLSSFGIPADSYIFAEANQSWIEGDAPDRYAGSLYMWNESTKTPEYCGTIHEDTMATIGFYGGPDCINPSEYCVKGDLCHFESVTVVPRSEMPSGIFTYFFQEACSDLKWKLDRMLASKKFFVSAECIMADLPNKSYYANIGVPVKSIVVLKVNEHNNIISNIKDAKAKKHAAQANSLGNLFPELSKLK